MINHKNLSSAEKERMDERAAILEFDAGWPRVIAESEARRSLAHERWIREQGGETGWMTPPRADPLPV
jgi:hypothetical protein